MASHKKGFTLIEIMVVTGIIGIIIGFGIIVDWRIISRDNFSAEQAKIVSILEKARSRAMANMFEKKHGVCYDATSNSYVIFQDICDPSASTSELISANPNIAENPGTTFPFPTFVFEQLTGNTTGDTIHIEDSAKSADIIINDEGTINW
ncbi:hypothetical protein A3C67_00520 [Candidatus Nomurabacteria bacterium RIFCSPHIGHO2_02_FULL_42_19]|uniref:Type II secretion system protein GspH n=1 Tax=Candidatus Nomurabacteria bacterium RIFCSPHIGHO2_02_FULL_42_19 TaxID=1801756 RepID=A0A1F6W2X2_9BACT|nr:MAG: hypothetical protein A3C67_00520 [Candidatus Nomurabacteria bacterium RIFCSPHIGHO2_02_FULL_42_19]